MAEKPKVPVLGNHGGMVPPFVHQSGFLLPPPQAQADDDIDKFSRDMVNTVAKVTKLKMVRDAINPVAQDHGGGRQDNAMAEAFKAMAGFNAGLTSQMTEMYKQNAGIQNNSAVQQVAAQVQKLTERLENVGKGGQASDMEVFFNGLARMETMGQILKKSLGIPDQVQTGPSDISSMLQMERLRMESVISQQQHEEKMKLMERGFVLEDRRETARLKLDMLKLQDEREDRRSKGKLFEDLIGSVMDGIDLSPDEKQMMGFSSRPEPEPESPPAPAARGPRPRIKRFTCQSCGGIVNVPSPDVNEVTCPGCQSLYDLNPEEVPPAAPPATPEDAAMVFAEANPE